MARNSLTLTSIISLHLYVFNGDEMIPPCSMSNKSLRGLLQRTQDRTFDGLTCEGEAAEWGREERRKALVWDFNDVEKAVNK